MIACTVRVTVTQRALGSKWVPTPPGRRYFHDTSDAGHAKPRYTASEEISKRVKSNNEVFDGRP